MNDRMLKLPEVLKVTGLSRPTVYRLIKEKMFPEQVKLTANCVRWRHSEIQQWIKVGTVQWKQLNSPN